MRFHILIYLLLIGCTYKEDKSAATFKDSISTETSIGVRQETDFTYLMKEIRLISTIDCTKDKASCAEIRIEYPHFTGLTAEVVQNLENTLADILDNSDSSSSLQQVAERYIASNERSPYLYEGERAWMTVHIKVELVTDTILSFSINSDFWGYAHYDNRHTNFVNVDPRTGQPVRLGNILDSGQQKILVDSMKAAVCREMKVSLNDDYYEDDYYVKQLDYRITVDRLGLSPEGFLYFHEKETPFFVVPYDVVKGNR